MKGELAAKSSYKGNSQPPAARSGLSIQVSIVVSVTNTTIAVSPYLLSES